MHDTGVARRPISRSNLTGGRNIIVQLRDQQLAFSAAEQKLAALVLAEAARVTRMSLAVFAAEASVSQPTAIRFCRALGCDGFPDFKIRLAQALMIGQSLSTARSAPATASTSSPTRSLRRRSMRSN